MRMKKETKIGILLLFGILFAIFFASAYSRSSFQYASPGGNSFSYLGGQGIALAPQWDESQCKAGQDFILQVAPFGCEPAVIRSDLLEEQNIPVFCKIAATKINPLIDVEAINYISFKGDYPKEVAGVGFHPAKAAIKGSNPTLLNSPILENIGYAVIVLKKQPSEREMPDFVKGTLTADITYDIKNAFGVGSATYYLPEINDLEWSEKYKQYGFWNGKGFLRADNIGKNSVVVSLYLDGSRKISSVNLEQGQISRDILIPGFYCMAGLQLRLDGLENPDTRLKLNINDEITEVALGEKFLESRCRVRNIEKQGLVQTAEIVCNTDDGGEAFELKISPRVKVKVGENFKEIAVGDKLYSIEESEKSVYLGYIGETADGSRFIVPVVSPAGNSEGFKETFIYKNLPVIVTAVQYESGNILMNAIKTSFTIAGGGVFGILKFLQGGDYPVGWIYEEGSEKNSYLGFYKYETPQGAFETGWNAIFNTLTQQIPFFGIIAGNEIKFMGFAGAENRIGVLDDNYNNAMSDYRRIIDSFQKEKENENSVESFGEKAFIEAIKMAETTEQKKDMLALCDEFEEKYPNSNAEIPECKNEYMLSNTESSIHSVSIDGLVKIISFEEIVEPTLEEYGAEIIVRNSEGKMLSFKLGKNQIAHLDDEGKEFVQLVSVSKDFLRPGEEYAEIKTNFISESMFTPSSDSRTLKKGIVESFRGGQTVTLTKVNLKKVAKVSVIPKINNAGTQANFTFNIGIEKRAIQLSTSKIKEKIETLNKTIEKWEGISKNLGNVVKGFKATCLGVGATLTIKGFFSNLGGKSIARQEVMRSDGGWFDICKSEIEVSKESMDSCLLKYSDEIDKDVEAVYGVIQSQEAITDENACGRFSTIRDGLKSKTFNSDGKESINVNENSDIYSAFAEKDGDCTALVSLSKARDIERLQKIKESSSASDKLKKSAEKKLYSLLSDIKANSQGYSNFVSLQSELKEGGLDLGVNAYGGVGSIEGIYSGGTLMGDKITGLDHPGLIDSKKNYPTEIVIYNNQKYLVLLNGEGETYFIDSVYEYKGVSDERINVGALSPQDENSVRSAFSKFVKYDSSSYKNKFTNPEVRYFETEPYKGLPAIVPFDTQNGWYAAMKQNVLGFGNVRAYDESGRISSFYLCNVGKNGKVDFNSGNEPDVCRGFNPGTGQIYGTFTGLNELETGQVVSKAVSAIEDASRQHKSGVTQVDVSGERIKVGNPSVGIPEMQCQDFMSPDECHLLFNACDPVVCPSSRCNLGGSYYVSDVVQSGIIGSLALCLPNIQEGIYVPVCLTGVKAGIDSLLSVYKNYGDCLQKNLETGENVGICDEIHSIYLCEFFWRQALPIADIAIPKALEIISGEGERGGGEYLGVASAWENAENSLNYMVGYYGANSYEAFKARVTDEAGQAVCRNFISARYPLSGKFFDALIEPDSPSQYSAWFSEIPFTTATVPPVSQYKVFYHIFAGKDSGAYYRVYLRSPTGTSFYQDTPVLNVASGYIGVGDYASETKDLTSSSGYKELCISVNAREECGFKQVSTEFALNYINDKYLQEQASQTDINSESECISGSSSLYSLANPNVQEAVGEMVNPALRDRGIVRVCSTDNPGKGTDINADAVNSRWVEVGTCDKDKGILKCWIDTNSVKGVVQSTSIEEEILGEVSEDYIRKLMKEGEYIEDFQGLIDEIKELNENEKINKINDALLARVLYNNQKANLLLLRGDAYLKLALKFYKSKSETIGRGALAEKKTVYLKVGEKNSLRIGEVDFLISLISISEDKNKVVVDLGRQTGIDLSKGTLKKIDLDDDGTNDFSVNFLEISQDGSTAKLSFEEIGTETPPSVIPGVDISLKSSFPPGPVDDSASDLPQGMDVPQGDSRGNAREKILAAAFNLRVTSSEGYANCFAAANHIYESADVGFKGFDYASNYDQKNEGVSGFELYNDNSVKGSISRAQNLLPGDIISIIYDGRNSDWGVKKSHSVIFIEWVDEKYGDALLYDWNGKGKPGIKKTFDYFVYRINVLDESKGGHVVYAVGGPVEIVKEIKKIDFEDVEGFEGELSSQGDVSKPTKIPGEVDAEKLSCTFCNEGIFNICDEKECFEIGRLISRDAIGTNPCVFTPNRLLPGGKCEDNPEISTIIEKCNSKEECQKVIGKKILDITKQVKSKSTLSGEVLSDAFIKQTTGAKNFECLVLQVVYQESQLVHCKDDGGSFTQNTFNTLNNNPLYCNGVPDNVLFGPSGEYGVMQINPQAHNKIGESIYNFEMNVKFGANLLINNYQSSSKKYSCNSKTYSGWQRALRFYNGWGCGGDVNYVENVIRRGSSIKELFPECN